MTAQRNFMVVYCFNIQAFTTYFQIPSGIISITNLHGEKIGTCLFFFPYFVENIFSV